MTDIARRAEEADREVGRRRFVEKSLDIQEYLAETARVQAEFAEELRQEYLPDLPTEAADHVFARAWSDGHGSGYYEVENQYMDLADMVDRMLAAMVEAGKLKTTFVLEEVPLDGGDA